MATRQLTTKQVVNLASDPASGTPGQLYYNTSLNAFKYYNGTAWVQITGGGGLSNVSDDTSPELGGNLDASSFNITNVDNLSFDTTPDNAGGIATLVWDDGEGTLKLGLKGGNVSLQLGQENVALCYNGTGSAITNGSVVYISGAQGQRPSISLADADTEATSSKTFGIATENIANGAEGFVATFGIVNEVNTSAFTEGQALWLSSTAGQLTNVKPSVPTHAVFVGYCLKVNSSSGRIFVNPQNGYEIEELHNVSISSLADNHILSYDNATSLWKNQGLAAAIQEVDGASSGIDADLLDGQHGSYYAPIASPTFTGTPSAPTASALTNTTQIATTAFVRTEISNLVDAAPSTLDTLNELAAALGDDPNFATTVSSSIALKAPIASPTFTGTVTIPTLTLTTADTSTAASHYFVETGSDGTLRPKTLSNVRTEIVTTSAVNSAAATTVGTITTGTWQARIIGLAYGGTNSNLTAANGGVVYSTASAMAITAAGVAGQVLTSNGSSAPTWQTPAESGFNAFLLSGM